MTRASEATPQEVRKAYAEILPHSKDAVLICAQLLKSIGYCENVGSTAWSVSLLERGFRLNVGQVEVLTCFYTFWDRKLFAVPTDMGFLDLRFLVSGPTAAQLVEGVNPDTVSLMNYRSVNEPHWAVSVTLIVEGESPASDRAEAIALIERAQAAHRHFVVAAAHSPNGTPRKRSNFARFHCEALVTYAREETAGAAGMEAMGSP